MARIKKCFLFRKHFFTNNFQGERNIFHVRKSKTGTARFGWRILCISIFFLRILPLFSTLSASRIYYIPGDNQLCYQNRFCMTDYWYSKLFVTSDFTGNGTEFYVDKRNVLYFFQSSHISVQYTQSNVFYHLYPL